MLPPAPARFSTTTCWPRFSLIVLATIRATVSVPPPGSKPTTIVTGLLGKLACANALEAKAKAKKTEIHLISFSLEHSLSLLHEGLPAFGVILALEALPDPGLAKRGVVILLQHLAHDALRGAHGERRVGGDLGAVFPGESFQVRNRDHMVDEPHVLRLLRGELPAGNHDLARVGRADRVDEVFHRRGAVAQAHLGRRDAEARVVAGSGEHDDPHLLIRFKFCKNGWDGLPHVDRDGVAALGIVEDQPAEGAFLLRNDAFSHQTTPRSRRRAISPGA